ncbi:MULTISPECIES: hypothetical protein [unclassified Streptomyces]|uniref:hypothetical protein n=1 Tax=unclassified Streptomyces TaxID=2593676 RepID=UPI000DBA386C|nr:MULTISPECIES: hypothetical protein [unclassified Streptomyces]MYT68344.1 hypothetical protein [Streptomyces sp. SID8367]RAJ76980.1 hypothetical protein K377_06149 [Streptomyces sp. PsTaAH-137]
MTIRMWERRRRAAGFALVASVVALLITAISFVGALPGLPAMWWPKTGSAFAAAQETSAHSSVHGSDACDAVVGPAHGYCLGAPAPDAVPGDLLSFAHAWPFGVLAVGIVTLVLVTRRTRGL